MSPWGRRESALLAGTLEVATQRQASQLGSGTSLSAIAVEDVCLLKHEERPIVVRTGSTFEHHRTQGSLPGMSPGFFPLSVRC